MISYSQVDAAEGRDLSRRHDAFAFHEVSVADQPSATVDVMNSMVAEIWKEKVNERKIESICNCRGSLMNCLKGGGNGLPKLMPPLIQGVMDICKDALINSFI